MIRLTIDEQVFHFPERLTIEEWCRVARLPLAEPEGWPLALHYMTGAPLHWLKLAPPESLELGAGILIQLLGARKPATGLSLASITFGQWIDLDIWLTWGIAETLPQVVGILGPDIRWADEALYLVDEYAKWRTSMYKGYSTLFGLGGKAGEDEAGTLDRMEVARGWYRVMTRLAGNDLLKMDGVAAQPVKAALNMLAYIKDEDLAQARAGQQIMQRYELQRNRRPIR